MHRRQRPRGPAARARLDALLDGWHDHRTEPDSLSWVLLRTALLAVG
ncbi:MAG: hypothetical protein M3P31_04550 [Actinomycetota bacterium]|nr:hypothetical protein [Actinomycetota bacterium]